MSLVPDRFIVTAIIRELDENGNVVAERQAEPVAVFSCDQLIEWAKAFPEKLATAEPPPMAER